MKIERRIGFHIGSMDELKRIGALDGINLVELKPDRMRKHNDNLYAFNGREFTINKELAKEISDFCNERNIQINVHLPFEKGNDPNKEEGLCYGIREHHGKLMDRFRMLAQLYDEYRIGQITVMHPPQVRAKGKEICTYTDGLEHGREFLYMLDNERKKNAWETLVGVENMVSPKKDSITLGWSVDQLKMLLGRTETIGLTADSGHRNLSDEMSVAKMFALAPVVSMHFHTNPGVFHEKGYDDDTHEWAEPDSLEHFNAYIRGIRRFRIPVTCEISDLAAISGHEIVNYVQKLRYMLE